MENNVLIVMRIDLHLETSEIVSDICLHFSIQIIKMTSIKEQELLASYLYYETVVAAVVCL